MIKVKIDETVRTMQKLLLKFAPKELPAFLAGDFVTQCPLGRKTYSQNCLSQYVVLHLENNLFSLIANGCTMKVYFYQNFKQQTQMSALA